ncbi:MAG: glycosyltransferase family 2 protein [Gemmatimonadota bacterium]|jgi:glycosyltransferase involved in cell wall biosynthesis
MEVGRRVSVVIPAYNEQARIADVVREARQVADEVVVVDDASTDRTADVAEGAGAVVVRQQANRGYIAAIRRGFQAATGDVVVTLDGDGELPASSVPQLAAPILEGLADMVQGRRDWIPRPSERFLTWLAGRAGPVGDSGTGMRALRADLARQLEIRGRCICGVLSLEALAHGARLREIPISLRSVAKPRRIAWYHVPQIWHVLRAMRVLRSRKP